MYILTYLYILAEISAYHLQLKCMGGHFFPGHPCVENTTVLSDYLYFFWHTRRNINKYERKQMNVSTILAYVYT